jgi:phosphocarrier protein FPr/phosphocarrier protein
LSNLVLVSPMKGWVGPLDEVPDPVFAERLLGDGVAVDPTGNTVYAPCDGTIMTSAKHAVTLRATCGAEILIHVGLETVALAGEGFVAHVGEGRSVRTGDPLLTFDLDLLARKVKSLISPVVVTNGDDFEISRRDSNRETEVGEFLMELRPLKGQAAASGDTGSIEETRDVFVTLVHGIHARPAATLANSAKRFGCEVALVLEGRRVNAKSVVALMSLGVRNGARVTIAAAGFDARRAVDTLGDLIAVGLGEVAGEEGTPVAAAVPVVQETGDPKRIRGVSAAPGLAIGPVAHLKLSEITVAEKGSGIAHEASELARALADVRAKLELSAGSGDRHRRGILSAHIALLDDPELLESARCAIAEGKGAGFAWRHAVRNYVHALEGLKDARLRERVQDLLDLERQVLIELTGGSDDAPFDIPRGAILVARELLPSQLLALAERGIAGFCTVGGGPTAHVAILAAGMNIPAVVSAGERVLGIPEGTQVVLDADQGEVRLETDASALHELRGRMEARRNEAGAAQKRAREDCRTADGVRIEVFANLGAGAGEAAQAVAQGAEGCGLLRTEFLFQDRTTPPSEDEQTAQYQAIADALDGRPLIIRTFDIGGDKPVSYLALPPEENPALGLRGVRAALWKPDLLRTQLAAILRVRPTGRCRIMIPMVSSVAELKAVRAMLAEIARERRLDTEIALGVMVETPASAVTTDRLAQEADFFSIGTNDLTQYVLAMDRGNAQLASQIDALHPAVLRLIVQAAHGAKGKMVAVCGGLAADRLAAPLLIGLGVTELSAPPAAIPGLKQTIRAWRMGDCRALAEKALQCDAADDVRALLAAPAKTLAHETL